MTTEARCTVADSDAEASRAGERAAAVLAALLHMQKTVARARGVTDAGLDVSAWKMAGRLERMGIGPGQAWRRRP